MIKKGKQLPDHGYLGHKSPNPGEKILSTVGESMSVHFGESSFPTDLPACELVFEIYP